MGSKNHSFGTSPSTAWYEWVGVLGREQESAMQQRMTWDEICEHPDCQGRWVALHSCEYDQETGRAREGAVVDMDDDLASLCSRVQQSHLKNCAILFCSTPAAN